MLCKIVYDKLTSKYRELVNQFHDNITNGISNTSELDCLITKSKGLILLHDKGFLGVTDLQEWTDKVSEIVGEQLICEDIEDNGETGDDDKYIWLPTSPDCETEELIWEGYDSYCETKDFVL